MSPFAKRATSFSVMLGMAVAIPVTSRAQLGLGLGIVGATPPATAKTFDHTLDAKLVQAVSTKNVGEVQSLLKRGADPNAKGTDKYITPVLSLSAGEDENLEILGALVAAGANLEITNSQGGTPLIMASVDSHAESIKILLKAGAKIEAHTSLGLTALMVAASAGETEVVRTLLDAGANVNARSNDNGTALIYGSAKTIAGEGKLEIIKLLVAAGADVNVTATNGKTAAATAQAYGLDEVANYLLSIEQRDRDLFNAVAHAYTDRKTPNSTAWEAVKTALDTGANPRFSVEDGRTALMFLAYGIPGCDDATLQKFVAHSDLNVQEQKFGATALHLAVDNDNTTLVMMLIAAGAARDIKNKDGKTALDMALKKGNIAIIGFFIGAEAEPTNGEIPFYV